MGFPLGYYLLAFVIGALVGLSELLSRYAWTLRSVVKSSAGMAYLGLNGAVAVVAYLAAVEWEFYAGLEGKSEAWRVLVVSVLAMAVLRSSFANLRLGDKEFAAGFASFVEVFMRRAEKSLDRKLAQESFGKVTEVVQGVTYAATKNYFVAVSAGALRSLSTPEIGALRDDVAKIDSIEGDDATKMQLLAMRIVQEIGLDLFVTFAEAAKVKFASASDLAAKQASSKLQRLAEAKNLLLE